MSDGLRKTKMQQLTLDPAAVIYKIEGIGSLLSNIVCEERFEYRNQMAVKLINELFPTLDSTLFHVFKQKP